MFVVMLLFSLTAVSESNSRSPPLPQPGDGVFTMLFKSDTWNYTCFRRPALLRAASGRLLAFAEGRGRHSGTCEGSDVEIVLMKSDDGGKSWHGSLVLVHSEYPNDPVVSPCPVEDVEVGKVFLFISRNNEQVLLLESADLGDTWSDLKYLTGVPAMTPSGPGGIQIPSGRLLVGIYESASSCFTIYSDDHGKSWKKSSTSGHLSTKNCQISFLGLEEHSVKQLIMVANTPSGRGFSYSNDSGGSWSNVEIPASLDPQSDCQSSILSIPYGGVYLDTHLYLTQPRSMQHQNVSFYHSVDGGRTWKADFLLWNGPSGYSSLAYIVNSYKVACLFECGYSKNLHVLNNICLAIFSPLV